MKKAHDDMPEEAKAEEEKVVGRERVAEGTTSMIIQN